MVFGYFGMAWKIAVQLEHFTRLAERVVPCTPISLTAYHAAMHPLHAALSRDYGIWVFRNGAENSGVSGARCMHGGMRDSPHTMHSRP